LVYDLPSPLDWHTPDWGLNSFMAYDSIMQGLTEALDLSQGKAAGARVRAIEVPVIDLAARRAQTGLSWSK
jgi:hypothetical protein